jgi:hypothetical protein
LNLTNISTAEFKLHVLNTKKQYLNETKGMRSGNDDKIFDINSYGKIQGISITDETKSKLDRFLKNSLHISKESKEKIIDFSDDKLIDRFLDIKEGRNDSTNVCYEEQNNAKLAVKFDNFVKKNNEEFLLISDYHDSDFNNYKKDDDSTDSNENLIINKYRKHNEIPLNNHQPFQRPKTVAPKVYKNKEVNEAALQRWKSASNLKAALI